MARRIQLRETELTRLINRVIKEQTNPYDIEKAQERLVELIVAAQDFLERAETLALRNDGEYAFDFFRDTEFSRTVTLLKNSIDIVTRANISSFGKPVPTATIDDWYPSDTDVDIAATP